MLKNRRDWKNLVSRDKVTDADVDDDDGVDDGNNDDADDSDSNVGDNCSLFNRRPFSIISFRLIAEANLKFSS